VSYLFDNQLLICSVRYLANDPITLLVSQLFVQRDICLVGLSVMFSQWVTYWCSHLLIQSVK